MTYPKINYGPVCNDWVIKDYNSNDANRKMCLIGELMTLQPSPKDHSTKLSLADGCAILRLTEETTPSKFVETMRNVVQVCRDSDIRRLLVDARGLSGPAFSTYDRVKTTLQVLTFWDRKIRMAMVLVKKHEDDAPNSLARYQFMPISTFTDEEKALAWLWQKADSEETA